MKTCTAAGQELVAVKQRLVANKRVGYENDKFAANRGTWHDGSEVQEMEDYMALPSRPQPVPICGLVSPIAESWSRNR